VAKLVYSTIASLDGFVADAAGDFDWAAPDEEVHGFVNDMERSAGLTSTGAGCTRSWWPGRRCRSRTKPPSSVISRRSGARPRRSSTPERSRRFPAPEPGLSADFDPESGAVDEASAARHHRGRVPSSRRKAIAAGLVDGSTCSWVPVLVGGGKRALPAAVRVNLELIDERRFRGRRGVSALPGVRLNGRAVAPCRGSGAGRGESRRPRGVAPAAGSGAGRGESRRLFQVCRDPSGLIIVSRSPSRAKSWKAARS